MLMLWRPRQAPSSRHHQGVGSLARLCWPAFLAGAACSGTLHFTAVFADGWLHSMYLQGAWSGGSCCCSNYMRLVWHDSSHKLFISPLTVIIWLLMRQGWVWLVGLLQSRPWEFLYCTQLLSGLACLRAFLFGNNAGLHPGCDFRPCFQVSSHA